MKKFESAYITGANAKIAAGVSENLVSENLRNTITVETFIDDVQNNPYRSATNLLYNYEKQWYEIGRAHV